MLQRPSRLIPILLIISIHIGHHKKLKTLRSTSPIVLHILTRLCTLLILKFFLFKFQKFFFCMPWKSRSASVKCYISSTSLKISFIFSVFLSKGTNGIWRRIPHCVEHSASLYHNTIAMPTMPIYSNVVLPELWATTWPSFFPIVPSSLFLQQPSLIGWSLSTRP